LHLFERSSAAKPEVSAVKSNVLRRACTYSNYASTSTRRIIRRLLKSEPYFAIVPSMIAIHTRCSRSTLVIGHWTLYVISYRRAKRKRNEFVITDTELRLIAAAATMGLKRSPNAGYRTPAASGMPSTL
jgi:hypothetical protein